MLLNFCFCTSHSLVFSHQLLSFVTLSCHAPYSGSPSLHSSPLHQSSYGPDNNNLVKLVIEPTGAIKHTGHKLNLWKHTSQPIIKDIHSHHCLSLRPGVRETHHLTGQQESRDAQELEAVGSHGRGCQETVHDVHRQAAALEGQTEVLVDGDEPADQRAAVLGRQLRGNRCGQREQQVEHIGRQDRSGCQLIGGLDKQQRNKRLSSSCARDPGRT